MVRAWHKKGDRQKFSYCQYCEQWFPSNHFDSGTYYQTNGSTVEHDGEYYYDSYYEYTIWFHDGGDNCCDEVAADVDEAPRSMKVDGAYVCGECNREYPELDLARECCS